MREEGETQCAPEKARRWVVERTHSWLTCFRRLLVHWEMREDTCLAMLHFALGLITWFHELLPRQAPSR